MGARRPFCALYIFPFIPEAEEKEKIKHEYTRIMTRNDTKKRCKIAIPNKAAVLCFFVSILVLFGVSPFVAQADSSTISVSVTDGEAFHEETIVYTAGGAASLTNTNDATVNATIPANAYKAHFR